MKCHNAVIIGVIGASDRGSGFNENLKNCNRYLKIYLETKNIHKGGNGGNT